MTFESLPPRASPQMELALTQSSAASLVRTLAKPAPERGSPANAPAYGRNLLGSFASFDLASLSWRTSQRCLVEGWATFSETWPPSGIIHFGIAYRLAPSGLPMNVIASLSYPTPSARDWKDSPGMSFEGKKGRSRTDQLARFVYALERTPADGGRLNPEFVEWLMGFPIGWTE